MYMRVIKEFDYPDQRGEVRRYLPGQLVDILARKDIERYANRGYVTSMMLSSELPKFTGQPASRRYLGMRVGIITFTSPHYSGGRIHIYQYAWCLAELGAQVFMLTNKVPKWKDDYPDTSIRFITDKEAFPPDCDIILTDSKQNWGKLALEYKELHPNCKLCCLNFETPNWVRGFVPSYASQLECEQTRTTFKKADFLMANSNESAKYLLEWLDYAPDTYCGILPPAVNTFSLYKSEGLNTPLPERPYALFSGRGANYKNFRLVLDTIWGFDFPFDLVVLGTPAEYKSETALHKLYDYKGFSDAEKFHLMKNAKIVCAPSLFEGYGMVPGEALCSNTPVLVYDLPVLRQEYGDTLIYVPWKDSKLYSEALEKIARAEDKILVGAGHIEKHGIDAMKEKIKTLKYHTIGSRRIFAHLIAYWGVIPESIESVYPYVDEILIAYGKDKHAPVINDGTLDRIQAFPDVDNKIKLEVREWGDKRDMRNWCAQNSSGNYQLLLDGDEIWVGMDKFLSRDSKWSAPAWVNFWHGCDHWVYDSPESGGTRWGYKIGDIGSINPHYRWSYWRNSYYFRKHPTPVDYNGNMLLIKDSKMMASLLPDSYIAHLGHSLPIQVMQAKHQFYINRDGNDSARRQRELSWQNWNGELGDCGDGIIERVTVPIPDIIRRGFDTISKITIA